MQYEDTVIFDRKKFLEFLEERKNYYLKVLMKLMLASQVTGMETPFGKKLKRMLEDYGIKIEDYF